MTDQHESRTTPRKQEVLHEARLVLLLVFIAATLFSVWLRWRGETHAAYAMDTMANGAFLLYCVCLNFACKAWYVRLIALAALMFTTAAFVTTIRIDLSVF